MSVFREVKVEFGGKEYVFTPSNKLLRRIDAELYPQTMFTILGQLDGTQAPLPGLACIVANMLNAGGGEFTEDEILLELLDDVQNNGGRGVAPLGEAIGQCVGVPTKAQEVGNSSTPATGEKKAKKAKAQG